MKNPFPPELEQWRRNEGVMLPSQPGDRFGLFVFPAKLGPAKGYVVCIAAAAEEHAALFGENVEAMEAGGYWDHVSVRVEVQRRKGRKRTLVTETPPWDVMCQVKDLFFDEEETVILLHPPKSEYVNLHPNVLHLWRPAHGNLETPPIGLL